jgi:hypothetical protein
MYKTVICAGVFGSCAMIALAQSRQATVAGEDGKPLAAVVHFVPSVATGGSPQFATSDAAGKLQLPALPNGDYEVCIQVHGGGYVNPCQWPITHKLSFSQTPAAGASSFVVKKGALVTVRIRDSKGLLAASPSLPLLVGVFSPIGAFYRFPVIQTDATGRVYAMTIPFDTKVNLHVNGPGLQMQDAGGKALTNGQISIPLQQAAGATDPVFTFQIAGKN